ncbi:MAG TPA: hypothetical protein PKA27_10495 [Fimbriimonadaceae bacterium]|nr:hypothetical protein [Fimbriimonadaceae bacterium]
MKAALCWLAFAVMAVVNGGFREAILKPRIGEAMAHVVSTILLTLTILGVTFIFIPWIQPSTLSEAWLIGAVWCTATLAFEFLAGHYVFGNPWEKFIADYKPANGRVWVLVPLTILVSAPLAFVGLPAQHVIPYLMSLAVGSLMLVLSIGRPHWCRWMLVALFAYAAPYNGWLAMSRPEEYVGFAQLAIIPLVAEYVRGPFKEHAPAIIGAIAVGQALIAGLMGLGGRCFTIGAIGAVVFLLAISPLGVGSALPFSFIVGLAAIFTSSRLADAQGI